MADKRISQLIERTDIANNDVLPIVASGATTTNKVTISTIQEWMQDNLDVGVTSVGLSMPSAFVVSASPVTTSGNISVTGAGTVAQYIRGNGTLADFPSISGGGSSVSYYLNGSVSQGTIGGVAYLEMNKVPILGTGTNFNISTNGYIASFITDAGDPALLEIPAGNWNFETYLSASSGGGSPTFYIELYKVNSGGTATLIASNSATPESISLGTNINPYFSALAVPTTTLALTDRLALRYYVTPAGRTITLHTENGHLCQIITTFTTGLTALNGLTAQVQNFTTGTSGTDFAISSASTTHTFNLPDASATARGVVTTGSQVFGGVKTFTNGASFVSAGGTNQVTRIVNIGTIHEGSAGSNQFGFNNSNNIYFGKGLSNGGVIQWTNAAVRYYTLPDADGTIALTSNLGAYLPLAGGTLTGALNGTSASFSGDIQSSTRLVAAAGGQQIVITPNLGGSSNRIETTGSLPLALVSAQAITLAAGGVTPQFTLASTGAATFSSSVTAGAAINLPNNFSLTARNAANTFNISLISRNTSDRVIIDADGYGTNIGGGGTVLINPTGGNVGIGTASPVVRTEVAGTEGIVSLRVTTNNGGVSASNYSEIQLADNSTIRSFWRNMRDGSGSTIFSYNDNLRIQQGSTLSMLINSTGAATFSSSVTATKGDFGTPFTSTNVLQAFAASATDANLFQVGMVGVSNGFTIQRVSSNLRYVFQDGNVGIGTASPLQPSANRVVTTINGPAGGSAILNLGTGDTLRTYLYADSGGSTFETVGTNTISANGANVIAFTTNSVERMRITSGGQVQITQTTNNYTNGLRIINTFTNNWSMVIGSDHNLYLGYNAADRGQFNNATGAYITLSDINKKKDFEKSTIGLDAILGLKPTLYRMKSDESEGEKELGFIAQEVKEFIPNAYVESGEFIGLNFNPIVAALVKAIQEQQEQINQLKNQIK